MRRGIAAAVDRNPAPRTLQRFRHILALRRLTTVLTTMWTIPCGIRRTIAGIEEDGFRLFMGFSGQASTRRHILILTTNQKVAGSSPAERAPKSPAKRWKLRRPNTVAGPSYTTFYTYADFDTRPARCRNRFGPGAFHPFSMEMSAPPSSACPASTSPTVPLSSSLQPSDMRAEVDSYGAWRLS